MIAAVAIDRLVKNYTGAERPAVNALSLTVQPGEIYGLLGPNGAGKSTTVMMLCGLLSPDFGTIRVFGADPVAEGGLVRSTVGVATQDIALFPSLTAIENLTYLSRMYGIKPDSTRLRALLDRFGLRAKSDQKIASLSGGMKRRINLIASLLHQPKLLILDEPTTGVDVQSRTLILDYLLELNQQGMTLIYSSHILEEAQRLCHRVGIMDQGQIIAQGSVSDLMTQYRASHLEEVFLSITGKSIKE